MTKQEVLDQCRIEGNNVFLPDIQLDRKLYDEVNKALTGIGGKWNRSAKAHVFTTNPRELLGRVQVGENINLKKDFQFFATPNELADRLVELAFQVPYQIGKIMEPSAGQGAIVAAIFRHDSDVKIYVCELMEQNKQILIETYANRLTYFSNNDFLKINRPNEFATIIANPPFTKGQDLDHVMHMYKCLESGGRIVSIMSTSWLCNNNQKSKLFRIFLGMEEEPGFWEKELSKGNSVFENTLDDFSVVVEGVNAGTFKKSGTMVASVIIVIIKN